MGYRNIGYRRIYTEIDIYSHQTKTLKKKKNHPKLCLPHISPRKTGIERKKKVRWASDGVVRLHIAVRSADRVKRSQSHQFLINTSIMGVNKRVMLTGNAHGASLPQCPSRRKFPGCRRLHPALFILTKISVIELRLWKWALALLTSCYP